MNDKTEKREIIFWSCDRHAEQLIYRDKDEAIEAFLDGCDPKEVPGKIEVLGFARTQPKLSHRKRWAIDQILDLLDEEFGDPEGVTETLSSLSEEIIEAEQALYRAILAKYQPWACEVVTTEEIDVAKWIVKNRPEWLPVDPQAPLSDADLAEMREVFKHEAPDAARPRLLAEVYRLRDVLRTTRAGSARWFKRCMIARFEGASFRLVVERWIEEQEGARYSKRGREGEWTRHLLRSLREALKSVPSSKEEGFKA